MNSKTIISLLAIIGIIFAGVSFQSCKKIKDFFSPDNVPCNTKHLEEFHHLTTEAEDLNLKSGDLSLFVDYSNCIADGMQSPFYQKMVSPLTAATKHYWSIKGDTISKESGNVYSLLNNVHEIHYAALDKAIEQMANGDGESVMLTDGELFSTTATKCSPNNPYMYAAFKNWLLKGHDIHIIAEPFKEKYRGNIFDKKRFYIIFTDDRMEGNIYQRIKKLVRLEDFPQVDEFHLGGNYPWIVHADGKNSISNELVAAQITHRKSFEIQDWQMDWENIVNIIISGCDSLGNPLPNGEKIIGGLKINKNAFGCYRIKDIDVKVLNINAAYNNIYYRLEKGEKIAKIQIDSIIPIDNFIIYDTLEFKRHGNVDLYFDTTNFAPNGDLDGKPFNYFKIEIAIKDLENILENSIDMFNFDSLVGDTFS